MKFKIGDKVVPHSKTVGVYRLHESTCWIRAKEKAQPYLYVEEQEQGISKNIWCSAGGGVDRNKFAESDLTLYVEKIDLVAAGKAIHESFFKESYSNAYDDGVMAFAMAVNASNIKVPVGNDDARPKLPREFQLGDTVRIRKDSKFYNYGVDNPKDVDGVIIGLIDIMLPVRVRWNEKSTNSYYKKDLELIKAVEDNQTKTMEKQKPKTFRITGKLHHLQAIEVDLKEIGYTDWGNGSYQNNYLGICIKNAEWHSIIPRLLRVAGGSFEKDFNLPEQWDECINFCKEQLPIAKKYFKKEEDIKVGSYIISTNEGFGAGVACKVTRIEYDTLHYTYPSGIESDSNKRYNRLATEEEISRDLIEEAKRRYPIGTKFATLNADTGALSSMGICVSKGEFHYNSEFDALGGKEAGWLYTKGKWTEPVKEETPGIKVGNYEGRYEDDFVKFGNCTRVPKDMWREVYNSFIVLETCGQIKVDGILINGEGVSKKQIEKVCNYFANKK